MQHFTRVTVPGSLREGICTLAMHGYWQAVMTSFEQELLGSCGFSLIPPDGLGMVISISPRLLLPSKSVLAYSRKQGWSAILEWDKEGGGWYWHTSDYLPVWEKKVKITNLFAPGKKGPAKPKSSKKGGEVVPFESDLPPIGRIVLKGSLPSSARTRSSARPVPASLSLLLHGHPQVLLLPAGHGAARERHPLILCPPLSGGYVISKSTLSFIHMYFSFPVVNTCMLVGSSSLTLSSVFFSFVV